MTFGIILIVFGFVVVFFGLFITLIRDFPRISPQTLDYEIGKVLGKGYEESDLKRQTFKAVYRLVHENQALINRINTLATNLLLCGILLMTIGAIVLMISGESFAFCAAFNP